MVVVGGLEDYDLAHLSAGHLQGVVKAAWQARRAYPWCRDTPLEIFERFTAAPRSSEERLERCQRSLNRRLSEQVKYCRTTGDAADAVGAWRRLRASWKEWPALDNPTPGEVLANRGGDCRTLALLFVYLARSVGLAARPVTTTWPTLGTDHYWVEVWDVEEKGWHSFDASAANRFYHANWTGNVPKAATHAAKGEPGAWNAARESRWEAYTNTVGLFYPSGTVRVRVVRGELRCRTEGKRAGLVERGMVALTSAPTDALGEARFRLGQSARRPYRFVLDEGGLADWEWLAVQAGRHYDLTLRMDRTRPFDSAAPPPPLGFPEWAGPIRGGRMSRLAQCVLRCRARLAQAVAGTRGALAGAILLAAAHYGFGEWVLHPGLALWRERLFWTGMVWIAAIPVVNWLAWLVATLGRVRAERSIFLIFAALVVGDGVAFVVWRQGTVLGIRVSSMLQDVQEVPAFDAAEAVAARGDRPALEMNVDVIPVGEAVEDFLLARRIGPLEVAQRLVGEHPPKPNVS